MRLMLIYFSFLAFSASTIALERCYSDTDCVAGTYCFRATDNSSSSICKSCLNCSPMSKDCKANSKCEDCSNDGYYMNPDGICTPYKLDSTTMLSPSVHDIDDQIKGTTITWLISIIGSLTLFAFLVYMGIDRCKEPRRRYSPMQERQTTPGTSRHVNNPQTVTLPESLRGYETSNMLSFSTHSQGNTSRNTSTAFPMSTNSIGIPPAPAQPSQVGINSSSQIIRNPFGAEGQNSLRSEEISLNLTGQQSTATHQVNRPTPVYGLLDNCNSLEDNWAEGTRVDLNLNDLNQETDNFNGAGMFNMNAQPEHVPQLELPIELYDDLWEH